MDESAKAIYKLIIRYNGTRYFGWQLQPNQKTIQGELNFALKKISGQSEVKSLGASRTDTGVHALGQVVKIEIPFEIDPMGLLKGLNSLLPIDIEVLNVELCSFEFQPVFHCKWKEYRYYFCEDKALPGPFMQGLVAKSPPSLNMQKIADAVKLFEGEHDFTNYFCVGTPVKSTVRTIYEASLSEEVFHFPWNLGQDVSKYYVLTFKGNGFLKQMVRLLVGALWSVGQDKVSLSKVEESLKVKASAKLGVVAPPDGLYLGHVSYSDYPIL